VAFFFCFHHLPLDAHGARRLPILTSCSPPISHAPNTYPPSIRFVCDTDPLTQHVAGGFWLKNWSERNTKVGGNPEVGKYIGIYFAIGIGAAVLTVVQTLILWIFCSIEVRADRPSGLLLGLTSGSHRHLASYTRGWRRQSSDRPCPSLTLHRLVAFSTGSRGAYLDTPPLHISIILFVSFSWGRTSLRSCNGAWAEWLQQCGNHRRQ
jgi:hypothetical protein